MGSTASDLKIKLTVTSDEHPELHRVLEAIGEPRRRTRRLKELAAAGLLLERGGAVAAVAVPPAALAGEAQSASLPGEIVGIALWDDKAG